MATNTASNRAKQKKTRQRRRAVETEYLAGYGAAEIHDRLTPRFKVTYDTIRKDIVEVRKAWKADVDEADEFEGRHRYLASLREVREGAMKGWIEEGKFGPVLKGVDHNLVHKIDKEIASLSGVTFAANNRTITLNMEKARGYLDLIFQIVFKHVEDEDTRKLILDEVDLIEDE